MRIRILGSVNENSVNIVVALYCTALETGNNKMFSVLRVTVGLFCKCPILWCCYLTVDPETHTSQRGFAVL